MTEYRKMMAELESLGLAAVIRQEAQEAVRETINTVLPGTTVSDQQADDFLDKLNKAVLEKTLHDAEPV